jgi:hypothetical protein
VIIRYAVLGKSNGYAKTILVMVNEGLSGLIVDGRKEAELASTGLYATKTNVHRRQLLGSFLYCRSARLERVKIYVQRTTIEAPASWPRTVTRYFYNERPQ